MTNVLYTFNSLKLWNSDVEMQHVWQLHASHSSVTWKLIDQPDMWRHYFVFMVVMST